MDGIWHRGGPGGKSGNTICCAWLFWHSECDVFFTVTDELMALLLLEKRGGGWGWEYWLASSWLSQQPSLLAFSFAGNTEILQLFMWTPLSILPAWHRAKLVRGNWIPQIPTPALLNPLYFIPPLFFLGFFVHLLFLFCSRRSFLALALAGGKRRVS